MPINKLVSWGAGILIKVSQSFSFGNALQFDGTNDYVTLDTTINSSSTWTFSCWFKTPNTDSGSIFGVDGDANQITRQLNQTTIRFYNVGTKDFTVPSMALNTWHHLVLTNSGILLQCYVDGVKSATTFGSAVTIKIDELGKYSTGGSGFWFNGVLDEVGVVDGTAATAQNVADLYNGGNGNSFTAIMGANDLNLHLDESGTAATAVDSGGSGNDGTLNNFTGTYWVAH